jgi:hypothetical protein
MSSIKPRRGGYSKQQLFDAIDAVKEGRMTSIKASQIYHVPQSTIRSHMTNSALRVGAGRSYYITGKEEGYLIDLIHSLSEMGIRLTKVVLSQIIGEYIGLVTKDQRFSRYLLFNVDYNLIFFQRMSRVFIE